MNAFLFHCFYDEDIIKVTYEQEFMYGLMNEGFKSQWIMFFMIVKIFFFCLIVKLLFISQNNLFKFKLFVVYPLNFTWIIVFLLDFI
jgi:hypothetical protein